LMADEDRRNGHRPDWYIAEQVGLSLRQICRIRQQFAREGLEPTLQRKPDLAELALKAMIGGALASWMTASIAGMLIDV